jgi:DNA-binding LytR/AlgR family response regulator
MENIKAIAIDDEPIALQVMQTHAANIPFLSLQACFESAAEALAYLQKEPVEVIFLDIQMPDISGVELAQILNPQAKIIFTTAYAQYAVTGFELSAVDYLLKPISYKRFLQACIKIKGQINEQTSPLAGLTEDFLFVKDGYNYVRVHLSELLYIEAEDNYLSFYEVGKRTLTRMKIGEALEKLPKDKFVRVHKSFIVALSKIEKIERHQLSLAARKIPISSNYREQLLQKLI